MQRPLISIEELVWLQVVAVTEFGGSVGMRDRGLLDAALARPLAGFGGTRLYVTPVQRAAALAEALVQNHGFVDGNKRTAMYAMGLWLEREGFRLDATQDELVDFALALAEHRMDVAEAAGWLEHHSQPAHPRRRRGKPRAHE